MDISLTKLRYLIAIARAESYSRAAEALNVSQPALSRAVAAIENQYGVVIFERGRSGARPTKVGAQIIAQIDAFLGGARTLDYNMRLFGRGEIGHLSLGLGPHLANLLLARLGRQVMAAKPRVKLRTIVGPPDTLMQALIGNRIDLFVSPDYYDPVPPEIELRRLGAVSVSLVVRADHPLAGRGPLMFAEIAQGSFATTIDAQWPGDPGLFICDNYYVMREVVLESDLVWLCARQFVEADIAAGRMAVLTVIDPPPRLDPRPIVVGRLKGRQCSRFEGEVIDFFAAQLGGADGRPATAGEGGCAIP